MEHDETPMPMDRSLLAPRSSCKPEPAARSVASCNGAQKKTEDELRISHMG